MTSSPFRQLILSRAGPEVYVPLARLLLSKLGYLILLEEEFRRIEESEVLIPDLLVVDAEDEGELDDELSPPVVLIAEAPDAARASRVAGCVRRPATMRALYHLLQSLTEQTPRSTPRIATELAAQCGNGTQKWPATILSLSDRGCLLRSPEPLAVGSRVPLEFELPSADVVLVEARVAYPLGDDAGLIFQNFSMGDVESIASFVDRVLLA